MRQPQQPLSEREIARRLLKIYELNGWPLPDRQQDQREPAGKLYVARDRLTATLSSGLAAGQAMVMARVIDSF